MVTLMRCLAEDVLPALGGRIAEEEMFQLVGTSDAWRAPWGPMLESSVTIFIDNGKSPV